LRRGRRARLAQRGRVEQHREIALHPSGCPGRLEHHVDEGLVDRPVAGELQEVATAGTALQGDRHAAEGGAVLESLAAEGGRRRDGCAQRGDFFRRDLGNVDLGAQGLAQGGLDGHAAQRERERIGGGKAEGEGCDERQSGQPKLRPAGL
jgi:hypothetical protein